MQEARTVVLCGYTYENVGLMFLSGDSRYPDGLGNNAGRLGRHSMTKMWADVFGFFSDTVFNGQTGPAAQMWVWTTLWSRISTRPRTASSAGPRRMSRTSASKEPVYLEKHAFTLDPYLEEPQLLTATAACVPPNPV